tara:strand:+ start:648 stop:845 length:198 start_codon:yes stop_codon:yes gene_type:complete
MKNKMLNEYMSDVKQKFDSLSKEDMSDLIKLLNYKEAPVLKKVFGTALTTLSDKPKKKRGLAARK